jgi:methylglutaconyl-CoA hydratase
MLRIHKQPPSGTITLHRPETRNALSREVVSSLIEAFDDFHREKSVRAVVLTSSGETFCSGVDLKQWNEIARENEPYEQWQEIVSELHELVEVMLRFPKPIIAAIDGPVVGMGVALVLACDLVVASSKVKFSFPASRLGLVAGLTAPLLTFRCGASVASQMLLGGGPLQHDEAKRLGLIHYIVPSELIWAKAHELSIGIATSASESVQMTKRILNEMVGESILTQLSSGAAAIATTLSTAAAREGLAAFVEKREPKFP